MLGSSMYWMMGLCQTCCWITGSIGGAGAGAAGAGGGGGGVGSTGGGGGVGSTGAAGGGATFSGSGAGDDCCCCCCCESPEISPLSLWTTESDILITPEASSLTTVTFLALWFAPILMGMEV